MGHDVLYNHFYLNRITSISAQYAIRNKSINVCQTYTPTRRLCSTDELTNDVRYAQNLEPIGC